MKKSSILLVCIMIFGIQINFAQKNTTEIHLKNGSIIYGRIIENIPDSLMKIKDECNNVWAIKISEIQNVMKFNVSEQGEKQSSFYLGFDTGLAFFGGFGNPGLSFMIYDIYKIKKRYYFGIITGVENFKIPIFPVAAEFQTDIFNRNITPYIYVRGGYAFKLIEDKLYEHYNQYSESYKGGIMFGAGIGIKKRFSSEFAMTFSLGYRHQEIQEKRDYIFDNDRWYSDYDRHYYLNRTVIRVALVF